MAICRAKEGKIESCREDLPTAHVDEREALISRDYGIFKARNGWSEAENKRYKNSWENKRLVIDC